MTEAQVVRIKWALEAKREELVADIRKQVSELAIGDSVHDPTDQIQNMTQRDVAVDNLHRLSQTLSSVEHSLGAITDGCYGCCVECGEPIAPRRLEIVPWATHCIGCQARLEQVVITSNSRAELPCLSLGDREAA
jgi:DnaK suppressor protein